MNVTIVFGSPRKTGNTRLLVEEAIRGLQEKGINVNSFYLNEMNIKGCQACYYCKDNDTGFCKVKDDMFQLHRAIEKSDGIIVAAPIYFSDVSAQTKIWLDRMFPFMDMNFVPKLSGKKAGFIFTQNQPNPELFVSHMETFIRMVSLFGFVIKGSVLAPDLDYDHKPDITERPSYLAEAYQLGQHLLN